MHLKDRQLFKLCLRNSSICRFSVIAILIYVLLFDLVFARSANAYLDPNTTGWILQFILYIFYGAVFVITLFWRKVAGLVKSIIDRFRRINTPTQNK